MSFRRPADTMSWLKSPILVITATQLLFTTGDLVARAHMRHDGFTLKSFLSWWFLGYFALRTAAMLGQLFVLANVPIGKSMALFGASSIALVNVFGFLLLGEVLTVRAYLGVTLAIAAFLVMALSG